MIRDFDLIVFDWDGTLANSIDWIVECIVNVAVELNLPVPTVQTCKDVIGLSLSDAMKTLFPRITEQQKKAMVESYRHKYMAKAITPDDLFSDTVEVLDALTAAGKTLAVATGKGRSGLDRAIDGAGVRHYFQELRCADEMQSKPSPHMLFDIMQSTQIAAEKTVMIGDSIIDLEMANRAEISSIGVTTGAHSKEKLRLHKPVACIDQLIQLIKR